MGHTWQPKHLANLCMEGGTTWGVAKPCNHIRLDESPVGRTDPQGTKTLRKSTVKRKKRSYHHNCNLQHLPSSSGFRPCGRCAAAAGVIRSSRTLNETSCQNSKVPQRRKPQEKFQSAAIGNQATNASPKGFPDWRHLYNSAPTNQQRRDSLRWRRTHGWERNITQVNKQSCIPC